MKLKIKVPYLMICFIPIFVFLVAVGASAAYQPEWLQTHLDGSLDMQGVYHGISFAEFESKVPDYDTLRLAKDRALDELCYQLSVSIQSKFEDSVVKKGEYEEQHIASSLFISTRNVLAGIEKKGKWTNVRRHCHWVLLVIDKEKADQQIETLIAQNNEIKKGKNKK